MSSRRDYRKDRLVRGISRKPRARGRRLQLERLEDRCVLSAVAIVGTALMVTGGALAESIVLRLNDGNPAVLLDIDDGNDGVVDHIVPRAAFNAIVVNGLGGNDFLWIDEGNGVFTNTELTSLIGGDGDDNLIGGSGNEFLSGGNGNDRLTGNAGNDGLSGGPGNDRIFGRLGNDIIDAGDGSDTAVGGPGNDVYNFFPALGGQVDRVAEFAGGGSDTLNFAPLLTPVSVNLNNDTPAVLATHAFRSVLTNGVGQAINFEHANGGASNDLLIGNLAANVINGNAGIDNILGGPNNDNLNGGFGNDLLSGNDGNDVLNGSEGSDLARGGPGNDVYIFDDAVAAQTDRVAELVGEGIDRLDFAALASSVVINLNNNTPLNLASHLNRVVRTELVGQAGNFENATGGAGNDLIIGNAAANSLSGGAGNDNIIGNAGNDTINAGAGIDTLTGGTGDDSLLGGDGNDLIFGNDGDDTLNGGAGTDTGNGGLGVDFFISIESITG